MDRWMNTAISEKMGSKERGVKFLFVEKSVSDMWWYFLGWCDGPLLKEKWVIADGWQCDWDSVLQS